MIKITDIANASKVSMTTVMRWKNRFLEAGIDGLEEQPRSGRHVSYGQEFKEAIFSKMEEAPLPGFSQWDGLFWRRKQDTQNAPYGDFCAHNASA